METDVARISSDTLKKVWDELTYRIDLGRVTNGAHIELVEYQSQIDTQGIFYIPHNPMTCVPTIFAFRKSIDCSRGRTRNLRLTKRANYLQATELT
ncbi:hypothetical protein TNCV_2601651 [Trichonephila clavipes]|nr:hypothetical protein TNCV_2601651 [Trichonephila clavipes]